MVSNKIYYTKGIRRNVARGSWQIFSKKLFQHFIHKKKKKLKVTKFKFKIICRTRVKNIPLWYSVRPSTHPPSPNRVKSLFFAKKAERLLHEIFFCAAVTLIPYFKISFCSSATSFLKYFSNPRSELTKLQVKMVNTLLFLQDQG